VENKIKILIFNFSVFKILVLMYLNMNYCLRFDIYLALYTLYLINLYF